MDESRFGTGSIRWVFGRIDIVENGRMREILLSSHYNTADKTLETFRIVEDVRIAGNILGETK